MTTQPEKTEKSWPRGIIIAYIIFVCATLGFVAFTFTVDFDLVVPDYYNQTLVYEDQIIRKQNMAMLSESVSVKVEGSEIQVLYPAELIASELTGSISIYRPSNAAMDKVVSVSPDSSGLQRISGSDMAKGMWTLKVTLISSDKEYYGEYPVNLR
jgi:hypothetical protein